MWTVGISVRLREEGPSGEEFHFEITEEMGKWPGLDQWEQNVRTLGFQMMRALFVRGLLLLERMVVPTWRHQDSSCHMVRRGRLGMTLATAFGKVRLDRQRLLMPRQKLRFRLYAACGHAPQWFCQSPFNHNVRSAETASAPRCPQCIP